MRAEMRTYRALVGVIFALIALPAPAAADCGGVKSSYPRPWHYSYRPPLVVGDSTMLLAVPYLAQQRMQANARGCRMWSEGMQLLRARRHSHSLPHLVVMGLGANWTISRGDIESALRVLGPKRILGIIAPREEGGGTSSDAYNVRQAGKRHPTRVKVLDWPRYSSGHGNWFSGDGLHMSFTGAAAYARYIGTLRRFAAPSGREPLRLRG